MMAYAALLALVGVVVGGVFLAVPNIGNTVTSDTESAIVTVEPSVISDTGKNGEVRIEITSGNEEEGSFIFHILEEDPYSDSGWLSIGESQEVGNYRFTLEDIEWDEEPPRWVVLVEEIEES